jgi:uncharacterized protein YcbK (DUF882 family)
MKLTANFSLKELIEAQMPADAIRINNEDITDAEKENCKRIAEVLQDLRNKVNAKFRGKGGRGIGLRITSGYRSKRWELLRGRSGNSMHVQALAADVVPVNCVNDAQYIEIYKWILHEYRNWNGGLANMDYKFKKGSTTEIESYGFIHIDLGTRRRWKY